LNAKPYFKLDEVDSPKELDDLIKKSGIYDDLSLRNLLMSANPHITDFSRIRKGTTLVIPVIVSESEPWKVAVDHDFALSLSEATSLFPMGLKTDTKVLQLLHTSLEKLPKERFPSEEDKVMFSDSIDTSIRSLNAIEKESSKLEPQLTDEVEDYLNLMNEFASKANIPNSKYTPKDIEDARETSAELKDISTDISEGHPQRSIAFRVVKIDKAEKIPVPGMRVCAHRPRFYLNPQYKDSRRISLEVTSQKDPVVRIQLEPSGKYVIWAAKASDFNYTPIPVTLTLPMSQRYDEVVDIVISN
jgi:hypothetical protein